MRHDLAPAIGLALALILGAPAANAQQRSWACGSGDAPSHSTVKAQYEALSQGNIAMRRIVQEYRGRWDAAFARQACEAAAAGRQVYIGCLNGRRDWAQIRAMIPKDYFGMSKKALGPIYRRLQEEGDGYREAMDYCRSVGASR